MNNEDIRSAVEADKYCSKRRFFIWYYEKMLFENTDYQKTDAGNRVSNRRKNERHSYIFDDFTKAESLT